MHAVVTTTPGTLQLIETPIPEPGPGELRIRVAAAGVNPADITTREGVFHRLGWISQPKHTGLGWDLAGTVDALGPGVVGPAVGARVAALLDTIDVPLGAYADFTVVPAAGVAVLPDGQDPIAAATVPLNALTAAQALDLIEPAQGRRLLITGAAGGVGGYAVALASRRGWQVSALARPGDAEFLRAAGATELLTELSGSASFDAVLDPAVLVGAALTEVRDGGTYVGVVSAAVPDSVRGIRTIAVRVRHDGARLAELLALAASGAIATRIAGTLPLADAAQAQANVEKGAQRGRWVLLP
jgi:NADPH:quinone reductase-like Zn-dependent oxidoreductase